MDTAKLGAQLHLQGSAKAAPPREGQCHPAAVWGSMVAAAISPQKGSLLKKLLG